MDAEATDELAPLLPDRHPQHDLFICDVADAVLKDVMQQMEHPFYSLSKKPETAVRRYEHNGNWIEITPSVKGLATIYDKDILIYCISQIMAKLKRGEPVSQRVRISSRDLLIFTNRGTSGRDYMALIEALDRLEGTRIRTNIVTGEDEEIDGFGLIDASSIRRKHGLDGRLLWCEIKLSDWVFNAIRAQEVLTLHRDYFRLRKPIERRVYELARKHCGQQDEWRVRAGDASEEVGLAKPGKAVPPDDPAPGGSRSPAGLQRLLRSRDRHGDVPQPGRDGGGRPALLLGRRARSRGLWRRARGRAGLGRVLSRTGMAAVARRERDCAEASGAALRQVLPELVRKARQALK